MHDSDPGSFELHTAGGDTRKLQNNSLSLKGKSVHPEFLYRYTSIKNLALMLRGRRIRFNRLDKVDDLLEGKSSDLGNLGRLFFVSCWSSSDEENIPLWSMYTPNMAGVRIKLPAKMFKSFTIEPQSDGFMHVTSVIQSPLPYERMITNEYLVNPTIYNFSQFLKEVEYTNDEGKLHPVILSTQDDRIAYDVKNFGKYKKLEWRFQSEWRYIIMIWPGPFNYKNTPASDWVKNFAQKLHSGLLHRSLPFNDFYLDLDESVINNIEVVLGPKASEGDRVIVESLLTKYCSNATLKLSNLKIR